jgi:predicted DNA-binding transcriptional regulator YafY
MTKRDFILRYLFIIRKLRNSGPASFTEISQYIEREFSILDSARSISLRTFQRDISEIRTVLGIDICCNSDGQYFIHEDYNSEQIRLILESFDVIHAFGMTQNIIPFVGQERKCKSGTDHLAGLLKAIRSKQAVAFGYKKYNENAPSLRKAEPLALKEHKGRWYLVARDHGDELIKIFGLDRILYLELLAEKFSYPDDFSVTAYFRDCYGVIVPSDGEPEEIELSFDPVQGAYIKSYPLHSSQKIIADNHEELRISLWLYVTHDLVMDLLSYGADLTILKPEGLVRLINEVINNMKFNYNKPEILKK